MPKDLAKPWKTLATRLLLDHPFHSVFEDTVELPSGRTAQWLRFGHGHDFVLAIAVDERGRVLLSRQYCHPPGRVGHEFAGGVVDPGESLEEAARRELLEEVGIYARDLERVGGFLVHRRRSAMKGHVFVATGLETRKAQPEVHETIEMEWLTVPEIEGMITEGVIEDVDVMASWTLLRLQKPDLFGQDLPGTA